MNGSSSISELVIALVGVHPIFIVLSFFLALVWFLIQYVYGDTRLAKVGLYIFGIWALGQTLILFVLLRIVLIGIGGNVDSELGRILAEATGAEFQVVTEEALSKVIEAFGKYF